MRQIDQIYLEEPTYGYRRITQMLHRQGYEVNQKRVYRLMKQMGIEAVYPKPRTTIPASEHHIWPYLLKNRLVRMPDEAWATDITYIPMRSGFMYLVAIIDWHSRFVLAWELSNTLDTDFCLVALEKAFAFGQPAIFNSDQGAQFTSNAFVSSLRNRRIGISMAGVGRCFDNIFIERLWRSLKYEEVYLKQYETVPELYDGLSRYFEKYCYQRPHQSLAYCTPAEVYFGMKGIDRPIYV